MQQEPTKSKTIQKNGSFEIAIIQRKPSIDCSSLKISEVFLSYDNSLPSILSDDFCYHITKLQ